MDLKHGGSCNDKVSNYLKHLHHNYAMPSVPETTTLLYQKKRESSFGSPVITNYANSG